MRPTPQRIVLVEDDPAMQLYVETVLHALDIEIVLCTSVKQALVALEGGAVRLLITDLMLPGESGIDLIEQVHADPARYGAPPLVVASAAIDAPGIKARLRELRVWRMLPKPVALDALESCVIDALSRWSAGPLREPPQVPGAAPAGAPRPGDVADAYFGGDRALYLAYRATCLRQFGADIAEGDRCVASADAPGLRRLAHNLKSVLATLGEAGPAGAAVALEECVKAADTAVLPASWAAVRDALQGLQRAG